MGGKPTMADGTTGKTILRVVTVPGKMVNIVTS
jgi:hypothetical protein